jgi:ubiquinone/menaquinone biosynthesis C-methylase UbiE
MNYENMLSLKSRLGKYDAGVWLDIATGRGDFLKFAMGSFRSWISVAGIDNDPDPLAQAKEQLKLTPVILVMDSVLQMPFTNGYFDTITMSNALHHIEDLPQLFSETARVSRKKGLIIINEMLNENNSAFEETYMLYHRLISDIDNQYGRYHRDTYTLKELLSLINTENFQLADYFIHAEVTGNVMNNEEIEAISERLRKKVALLKGSDYYYFYENKAREVINIFLKNGIHRPRHVTFILQSV